MYEMIFKRKSFHFFRNIGHEKLTEEDLQGIRDAYDRLTPLDPDIKTDIRIVPANEKLLGRGAEYAIELYSEPKDNCLMNAGYLGEQLDLYLVSKNIGSLWFGIGKPEQREFNGLPFVIMILIAKVDSEEKFRKSVDQCKRRPVEEIWKGDLIPGVSDLVRFAPSACNSQPWLVKNTGNALAVCRCRKPGFLTPKLAAHFNPIDIGIFLCFLDLCLEKQQLSFDRKLFVDPGDAETVQVAEYTLK